MIYGERLKEIREENDLKQADLGNALNIHKDAYGVYEREYQIMPIKHLNVICNYFGISLDYIFSFTNVKNYYNNNEINNILSGQRIKEFRKEYKITQKNLANILNTTQSTITGYETGRYLIATPFLYDICKKYHISADYLLGKIDNPKYLV